jgi:hypothetical protein
MSGLSHTVFCTFLVLVCIGLPELAPAQSTDIEGAEIKPNRMFSRHRGNIRAFRKNRTLAAGGGFHVLHYIGDLSPAQSLMPSDINLVRPGLSAWMWYTLSPRTVLRMQLMAGRLLGDDNRTADYDNPESSALYIRNLSFRNDIIELSSTVQFNLFRNLREYARRKPVNAYLLAGVGIFYSNPKARVPEFGPGNRRFSAYGTWVSLRDLGTEGQHSPHYDIRPYSIVQLALPVGGGVTVRLSERADLHLELVYRMLFTDYIDDVSSRYVDLGALNSELARALSDRSMEETAIIRENPRPVQEIMENTGTVTYTSPYNGATYTVIRGYGQEGRSRGGANNDAYLSTSIKISYILGQAKKHAHY